MVIGGESKPVGAGDIVVIHQGQNYTIENRSAETLVALAVVSSGGH
jgi:mannose-6-phosphate isomerase-like protein (cupin superfamily)